MNPQEFIRREEEIQQAVEEFPQDEIGEAYRKWKAFRGEVSVMLQTADKSLQESKRLLREAATKPCTQEGCSGIMQLESVCGGCVEGKKGYKSKWTCQECLHRELSKKDYMEWLKELASSLKE